jgi:hypothetical protein
VSSQQRQFPRYATEATVTLIDGATSVTGRTSNVSRGGACAMLPSPVSVGGRIRIQLALIFAEGQESEPLEFGGRVVWCTAVEKSFQVGLSFAGLTADQLKYLDLFLKYLDEGASERRVPATTGRDPFES